MIRYVDDDGAQNLKKFKYSGVCDSILYEYFLSDFAQSIVNKLPMWIAPNLITLTGFAFLFSALLLHLLLNCHFDQQIPSWLCYYSAFTIFMYQTLDNCDGKQARRTSSSSPLGCLLDHGTDCLTQWLIGIMLLSLVALGEGVFSFTAWFLVANLTFFFAIYQQIHTGTFKLGRINGVDEGLPFIQVLFIISGYFGTQIWQKDISWLGCKYSTAFGVFVMVQGLNEMIQFSISSIRILKNPLVILLSMKLPLTYTTCFVLLATLGKDILNGYQIVIMATLGFQWSKMIVILQCSLITKQFFSQKQLSWWIVIFSSVAIVGFVPQQYKPAALTVLLIYSAATYFQCILSLIHQIKGILGISVFTIKSVKN